ncbi:hypothetical protein B0H15DRAFT_950311 [Mycena belliarum]|uniref:MYND-type domain-containing protein n=1 Tax=Mycena belliarum TaxID=1033014 RepID=A0AAD6U6Z6_9AGAR|nr:hypothetical protein B0H15DRAFT_950311 [Mycena belliae]
MVMPLPLQPVLRYGVIAGEGTGAENTMPQQWTTRMCDLRDCENHTNLKECARCKTAMYCSKECQKADWAHHKPMCKLGSDFPPATDPETGGEPALQRHLRLWTARFNGSLVCATIVALELNKHPENIDKWGLLINLQPRPHNEAGSRFALVSAVVTPMPQLADLMSLQSLQAQGPNTGPGVMELHKQHRDALKKRSAGQEDYATVIVVARNAGPHTLPGGMSMEIRRVAFLLDLSCMTTSYHRFKPIQVHRKLVRSAQLNDSTLDWHLSLKTQVEHDMPNQTIVQ